MTVNEMIQPRHAAAHLEHAGGTRAIYSTHTAHMEHDSSPEEPGARTFFISVKLLLLWAFLENLVAVGAEGGAVLSPDKAVPSIKCG